MKAAVLIASLGATCMLGVACKSRECAKPGDPEFEEISAPTIDECVSRQIAGEHQDYGAQITESKQIRAGCRQLWIKVSDSYPCLAYKKRPPD